MNNTTEQKTELTCLQDLLDWINNGEICYVVENSEDYFTVKAPNDANWTVQFDKDDDINKIISKTIAQLEAFDADNEFTELWSDDFANRNHFKPSQFIEMLQEDETTFKELAQNLDEVWHQK